MTALREAAQQVLEALYQAREFTELYDTEHAAAVNAQCHENITALRAALEQQDERDWSLLEATQESLREHMAEIHRLRAALAQQAEPVAVAERERIAAQWDGCVAHQLDTFGPVDIGASIRAGELVEPAQQAEPVDGACLHGVDDGACKECYAANAEPVEPVATLTAQRDALLEALRKIGQYTGDGPTYSTPWQGIVADLGQTARAAIAAVEGEKT